MKYYITAMLFIVFDIEIVFLYPWAASFDLMGTFALVEMVLFIVTVFVAYIYVLRRGWPGMGLTAAPGTRRTHLHRHRPDEGRTEMGVEEKLPSGVLLTTVEGLFGYMRSAAFWPATFGLACCAIEMMTYGAPRYDSGRWGQEVFRASPRQADLMIVAGRVSQKMAPVLRQIYDQMPNPKWVLAMGVCASTGGMFNNYAIVQGVDHVVPVDMYLPGCPPRPEMLIDAMFKLARQGGPHPDRHPRGRGGARPPSRRSSRRRRRASSRACCGERRQPGATGTASGEPINAESDAKARVKGAVPEGESAPDAGTEAGLADRRRARRGHRRRPRPGRTAPSWPRPASPRAEVLETRRGMFGVRGTGDTSGYGGLTKTIEFPSAGQPPFGGWWDSVHDRVGELLPNSSDVITKVVVHRGEITFHVARQHLPALVRHLRDDAQLRFEFCSSVSGVHYPADAGARAARRLPPAVDDPQPADPARGLGARRRPAPALGGPHLPHGRLARARDVGHVRGHLRRPPGPDADPDARRLARATRSARTTRSAGFPWSTRGPPWRRPTSGGATL